MKVVKNDMVSMDWNADGFIETKKAGFIAAVHNYDGTAVAFKDGKVYTHIDEDGNNDDFSQLVSTIKKNYKDNDYPYYFDDYAEIYDGIEFTGTLGYLGLEDYKDDILARVEDLSGYNMVEESDTPLA